MTFRSRPAAKNSRFAGKKSVQRTGTVHTARQGVFENGYSLCWLEAGSTSAEEPLACSVEFLNVELGHHCGTQNYDYHTHHRIQRKLLAQK